MGPEAKIIILEMAYTHNIMGDRSKLGIFYPIIFFAGQGFFYWFLTIAQELGWVSSLFDGIMNCFTGQARPKKAKIADSVSYSKKFRE